MTRVQFPAAELWHFLLASSRHFCADTAQSRPYSAEPLQTSARLRFLSLAEWLEVNIALPSSANRGLEHYNCQAPRLPCINFLRRPGRPVDHGKNARLRANFCDRAQ